MYKVSKIILFALFYFCPNIRIFIGVPIYGVNVLEDPVIRATMKEYSNWPTFPQVYIKNEFIGGRDILAQMHSNNEIEPLIKDIVQK